MNVLLSIKPEYVAEMLKGNKKYEFRRLIFKNKKINRIYIYATSPVGKIVGSFAVGKILEGSPAGLWRKCKSRAGISKEAFFKYFRGSRRAFAIQITALKHFNEPLDPYSLLDDFTPPQSFCYLPPSIPELDPHDKRLTDF